MTRKPKGILELRETIRREVPFVDIKPFSHNIISLALSQISALGGRAQANKAIRDFDLAAHGWSEWKED